MENFSRKHRVNLTAVVFVYPALVYMILLVGFPILYNIIISFQNVSVMTIRDGTYSFTGLGNYVDLIKNRILLKTMRQTFFFTFFCLLFQFSIGLIFALFFKLKFLMAKTIRGLLLVIWVVPMTITALIFKFMLQTDGGLVNVVLQALGLVREPVRWLVTEKMAMVSVIVANCWVGIPFNMILLLAGLNGIPDELYESAGIDGAGYIVRFFRITLPLLRPAIMSVLILGVIYTFKVFDLVYVMTSGGPVNATELLSTYSYRLSFREYQFSLGASVANVLFVCLIVVASLYLGFTSRDEVM
ncbi:MAG: sugar ABC transporter permease [Treponema sp.]|jgi:multiple sugar transport system permease protein|nr:sugar ABC transporter permease [Treponema sp.]